MPRYPVSISFEKDELRKLDGLARKFHQTRSAFLKTALADYIRRLEFERLRQMGQGLAREKNLITDEDIFAAVS